jgi:ABC-type polysaccharide/polyol phosphate export permease
MAADIRTVMPLMILLTLRPTETWTSAMVLASLGLLAAVVVGLGWWIASATAPHDADDAAFDEPS